MSHNDQYHCAICGDPFKDSRSLNDHEKERHTQQGITGVVPSNEYPEPDNPGAQERQHKKFERRNWE
jgi:hypothetical protein